MACFAVNTGETDRYGAQGDDGCSIRVGVKGMVEVEADGISKVRSGATADDDMADDDVAYNDKADGEVADDDKAEGSVANDDMAVSTVADDDTVNGAVVDDDMANGSLADKSHMAEFDGSSVKVDVLLSTT